MTPPARRHSADTLHGFMELFSGRRDALGTGAGGVVRKPVIRSDYDAHLGGRGIGLGIFPLRDDGTVSFAAVDLDAPDFELARKIAGMLPGTSWVERSRSGNAHVWVFFAEPVEAWVPRGVMREALAALGMSRVEVFPKQDRLGPGMLGNYINLPYHGDSRPIIASSIDADARPPTLDEFVAEALELRNDPASWRRVAAALGVIAPELRQPTRTHEFGESEQLHICASHILDGARSGERPITDGHRAVVYFNVAKQLLDWKHMDEETAWELVQEMNDASPDPAPERELRRIFDNAASGRYTSTGCDDPVMAPYIHPECPIAHPNH